MFGLRFVKSPPTVHLLQYKAGVVVREGVGQSFFYFEPASSLAAVPLASQDRPFILELTTADFQSVTVQGQVTFRVSDPRRTAAMMDFSLAKDAQTYCSEDPKRLGDRVASQVEVIIQQAVQALALKPALQAAAQIAFRARQALSDTPEIHALGLEILGVSIMAVRPTPDIARALEAEARESNLKAADDAVYERRMSAVEKERAIKENELDTDIAAALKRRQMSEAQIEAKAEQMRRENEMRVSQMDADVALEIQRKALVASQAENARTLADADAYGVQQFVGALGQTDPRLIQALMAADMDAGQLIAQAFGGLAERAGKIGTLNMSPELLHSLVDARSK